MIRTSQVLLCCGEEEMLRNQCINARKVDNAGNVAQHSIGQDRTSISNKYHNVSKNVQKQSVELFCPGSMITLTL